MNRVINYSASILLMLLSSGFLIAETPEDSLTTYQKKNVVVSGDRAVEGISPIPFANITRTQIEKIYVAEDIPELLTELPSTISYSESGNNIGYSYLTMRGFSQHRISVFVNGIPQNDPEDHNIYWIDLPDIASSVDNIQVQRGAGIVNYGAASIGGSINLTTTNLGKEKGIKLFSGIGVQEFGAEGIMKGNMNKSSIEVSSGRVGKYSFYGRLSKINSEGYRDNMWTYMNSYYLSAARYDDNFTTRINVFGGPITDGLGYMGLPKSYIKNDTLRRLNPSYWEYVPDSLGVPTGVVQYFTPRREQEIEEFSQPHYEMLNTWYGDNFVFESSLFYYTGDGFFDYDGGWADALLTDWVKEDYTFPDEGSFRNSLIRGSVSNKHGGWIPRVYFEHPMGSLSVGAEIRFHRSQHFGDIIYSDIMPGEFDSDYHFYYNEGVRNTYSIFASEKLNLQDDLTLTIQGQFVNQLYQLQNIKQGNAYMEFRNIDGQLINSEDTPLFDINYFFFNPRISLNYNYSDEVNIYVMAASTSREPRMKNLLAAEELYYGGGIPQFESVQINDTTFGYDFTKPLVTPETMIDIELGTNYKSEKYFVGVNFYWMEYFDELVSTGILDLWGRPVDGNVPRTRHIGLELQGHANLFKSRYGDISVGGNATISNNKIVEFDYIHTDSEGNNHIIDLKDNEIAGFPSMLFKARFNYQWEGLFASLSVRSVGKFKTDNFGDMIGAEGIPADLTDYADNDVDSYGLLNFDFSYTFNDVLSFQTIKIQGKVYNITNALFATYGTGGTFFPGAERNFFLGLELGL